MKRFDQINMVPFIDIVLVLLAIVMTTASFISKGLIEVDLPESESAEVMSSDRDFKEIAINHNGDIFYEGEAYEVVRLSGLLAELPKQTQFNLRVDKQADFESFISVVDVLKHLELEQVAIETIDKS